MDQLDKTFTSSLIRSSAGLRWSDKRRAEMEARKRGELAISSDMQKRARWVTFRRAESHFREEYAVAQHRGVA
jgi:hypothetical protein